MNNVGIESPLQAASLRFAEELNKLPVEEGVVIGLVLPGFMNGCSWCFVTDTDREFKKYVDLINKNPKMSLFKIKGGYLVFIDMSYLSNILKSISSGFISNQDLVIAGKNRQKALMELDKQMKKKLAGLVGIYNLNDTNTITIKGVVHPAFCVSVNEFLTCCVRHGRKIKVQGKVYTPDDISRNIINFISTLMIAPSGNALFVELV